MRLRGYGRTLLVGFALCALLLSVEHSAAADPPTAVLRKLTAAVVSVLQHKERSFDRKLDDLRGIVEAYVDFRTMSRLILARNWAGLTDSEKSDFVEEFRKHLTVTYGKILDSYNDQEVRIVSDRDEGRGDWTVLTKILRPAGGGEVSVDYRLRQVDGEWKIIDLVIEKVSLVSNFRSQFQEVMANGGIDTLLQRLREKNAAASQRSALAAQKRLARPSFPSGL